MTVVTLSPAPAHCHVPAYSYTYGSEAADLAAVADFNADEHQRFALDVIFGRRDDGLSAAFEVGLVVGRQNLKSGVFKICILAWLYLFGERLVVYSAHEFTTAMEFFADMELMVTSSDYLRRRIRRIVRSHGEEAIQLVTGARVIFKTRTKGGGRGLSGRKVVLDEGYALHPPHMGALLPTLSAQPDPQVLYGSSAGRPESGVMRGVRDRGRAAASDRLAYIEYCAPDPVQACDAGKACKHSLSAVGCGCDKPDLWLRANPAIGRRMTIEYVRSERQALPVDEFTRERMGWWDDPIQGFTPMPLDDWARCADVASRISPTSRLSIAFEVADDSSLSAIAIAGWRPHPYRLTCPGCAAHMAHGEDGAKLHGKCPACKDAELISDGRVVHAELIKYLPGTGWLLDELWALHGRRNPVVVVLNPHSAAGVFEAELRNGREVDGMMQKFVTAPTDAADPPKLMPGQKLMQLATMLDYAQACGKLINDVTNNLFRHPDQAPVNKAVEAGRELRTAGRLWIWDSPQGAADITPIKAVTLAKLGLETYGQKDSPTPFFA